MTKKKPEILTSAARIQDISLNQFMDDISEIIKSDPALTGLSPYSVTLRNRQGQTISLGYVSDNAFNVSCSDPNLLNMLLEATRKFYES